MQKVRSETKFCGLLCVAARKWWKILCKPQFSYKPSGRWTMGTGASKSKVTPGMREDVWTAMML